MSVLLQEFVSLVFPALSLIWFFDPSKPSPDSFCLYLQPAIAFSQLWAGPQSSDESYILGHDCSLYAFKCEVIRAIDLNTW